MNLQDRVAVVTGGGHGIGRALAESLAARGAKVVVADIHVARAEKIAARIGGRAVACDVGDPHAVASLVQTAEEAFGPVDVFVSNAGFSDDPVAGVSLAVDDVERIVAVNLLAHVWAAKAVLPGMIERGQGWLVQTISSAALITGPSGMGYTLSKHGALGFAEWVALNHRHQGIHVTCLCPNAVNTGMLGRDEDDEERGEVDTELLEMLGDVVEPELCAAMTLEAMETGRFLVLPHPRVGDSFLRKATDYDAWLERTNLRLRRMRGEVLDPSASTSH
jgi:NAD(P)-dependent dehydrogenase (short-subunit alcohol dehydrogenase family)